MLIDAGDLDINAPVTAYWPEFGAEGKANMPVRYLLTHQAGLPAVDRWITLDDCEAWTPVIDALAAQRPYWEPGTAHGYHGLTIGWLVGEVIRRITGLTPGQFARERIAKELPLDLWIGLPEEHEKRVATVARPDFATTEVLKESSGDAAYDEMTRQLVELYTNPEFLQGYMDPSARTAALFEQDLTMAQRAFGPVEVGQDMDARRHHALEIPAATGISDARSLARLYASLVTEVDGIRLVGPETVDLAATCYASGPDQVVLADTAWGLGFSVPGGRFLPAFGPRIFGCPGANGALGFADPDAGIGVGYVRNRMVNKFPDPCSDPLVHSLYSCL